MSAPKPPWLMKDLSLAVFYLVSTKRARPLVPESMSIIEVAPGYTLGALYASRHRVGEISETSEFGALPAYVRHEGRKGFYLDCLHSHGKGPQGASGPASLAWEVTPKKIALQVVSGRSTVIKLRARPLVSSLPLSLSIAFLCVKGESVVFFKNIMTQSLGLATSSVSIPKDSPIYPLPFGMKLMTAFWDASNVVVKEPEYATETVMKRAEKAFGSSIGKGPGVPCR